VRTELNGEIAREVLYRRDVLEGLVEALIKEPLETVALKRDKIRYVENLGDLCERSTLAKASLDNTESGSTGHQAIPPQGRGAETA
jgi:hypothetical protein